MKNVTKKDKALELIDLEFICNGYYPKSQKETSYSIELSVADDYVEYFKELLGKHELNSSYYNYTITIALRELSWFRNIVFKEVTAINEKHKYVYLVMMEWLTEDGNGPDYYLYKDYAAAKNKYKRLIKDECDADISWVGSEAFDENGNVNDGFHFKCSEPTNKEQDLFWEITDLNNPARYTVISLTKVEILGS